MLLDFKRYLGGKTGLAISFPNLDHVFIIKFVKTYQGILYRFLFFPSKI